MFLFDERGAIQDKFKAKGNSEMSATNDHPFTVQDICYSPDNSRLALAQSDNILFVYKLGLEWKEKKTISNKFFTTVAPRISASFVPSKAMCLQGKLPLVMVLQVNTQQLSSLPPLVYGSTFLFSTCSSLIVHAARGVFCICTLDQIPPPQCANLQASVTKVQWRTGADAEILFGLSDGSLQLGRVAQNKSHKLYNHSQGAAVVSMCCIPPPKGLSVSPGVIIGHADGSICRFMLDASTDAPAGVSTICRHSCAPCALACNRDALLAGGTDLKVTSYTIQGRVTKNVDLGQTKPEIQDLTCAAVPAAGDSAVVGAFNAFLLFDYNAREQVRSAPVVPCNTCFFCLNVPNASRTTEDLGEEGLANRDCSTLHQLTPNQQSSKFLAGLKAVPYSDASEPARGDGPCMGGHRCAPGRRHPLWGCVHVQREPTESTVLPLELTTAAI